MKKTNNKKNRRNQKKNKQYGPALPGTGLTVPVRSFGSIMPDRLMTRLRYKGIQKFTISTTTLHTSRRWSPTSVYDVDPLLGSTATAGFNELASFYNSYRCLASSVIVRAANMSTTPVMVILIPLNVDPGSAPTLVTVQAWIDNPYGKNKLVAYRGGPVSTLSSRMTTEKIYGSKMIYFDDNFASLTNTIPNNNWYWAIALLASDAVTADTDVLMEVDITMDVEFYDRKLLLN